MLCLLYYICFEQLGYESSDYNSLGSEWIGSECEGSEPNLCMMRNLVSTQKSGSEPSHSKPNDS